MTLSKNLMWVAIILIVAIIAALIVGAWYYNRKKNKTIELLTEQLVSCQNAPADTVKIKDSIVYKEKIVFKPYPVKVIQYDSILVPYKESFYDSSYRKDGWRIHYNLKTLGSLDYIEFTDLVAPKEIITITRKIDTCINRPIPRQPMFRLGLYAETSINNFSSFPGLGVGGQVIFNDQITLATGVQRMDKWYWNVRIGWILKK